MDTVAMSSYVTRVLLKFCVSGCLEFENIVHDDPGKSRKCFRITKNLYNKPLGGKCEF